jgi:hypothetical protein
VKVPVGTGFHFFQIGADFDRCSRCSTALKLGLSEERRNKKKSEDERSNPQKRSSQEIKIRRRGEKSEKMWNEE